jgi:hypothetical protein
VFRPRAALGHGGVPIYQWQPGGRALLATPGLRIPWQTFRHLEPWALFGFAVLDLRDEQIAVRYIDELGQEHYQEILV